MSKFIDKTLPEIFRYIKDSMYSEEYAGVNGFLQSMNTKFKLISLIIFLLGTIFTKNIFIILLAILIFLSLTVFSKISLIYILKRILLFVPLFTAIIAVPYIFNIFQPNDGHPLIILYNFHRTIHFLIFRPFTLISITSEGVYWASVWTLRVTASVSFMILLIMTTKWSDLMNSLGELKIPKVFILILGMSYRYIFLLIDTLTKMLFSRKSRAVGKESSVSSWKLNSGIVGALFIKSYDLGNNVYLAMVSRGFDGNFKKMSTKSKIKLKSIALLLLSIGFFVLGLLV
ncbi:MAG: cobalt ECF transporter T component CbiQ [Candidatus Lokiarchaeota archaeon]